MRKLQSRHVRPAMAGTAPTMAGTAVAGTIPGTAHAGGEGAAWPAGADFFQRGLKIARFQPGGDLRSRAALAATRAPRWSRRDGSPVPSRGRPAAR